MWRIEKYTVIVSAQWPRRSQYPCRYIQCTYRYTSVYIVNVTVTLGVLPYSDKKIEENNLPFAWPRKSDLFVLKLSLCYDLFSAAWQKTFLRKWIDRWDSDLDTGLKLENYYFFTFTFSRPEVRKLLLFYVFTFSRPEVRKLFRIYVFTFSRPEVRKLFRIYVFTFSRPEVGKLFHISKA